MRILITEVTEMHQGNYCVAGWCSAISQMVRPLPNGANWTSNLLAEHRIIPGATVRLQSNGVQPKSNYPHRTEDTPISTTTIKFISPGPEPWFGAESPPTAGTLADAFGGHLRTTGEWNGAKKAAFVREGTRIGSLSALKIAAGNFEFFEDKYEGKKTLRAYMEDSAERYSLPVVAKSLREAYRGDGLNAISRMLPRRGCLHVRVGLARAWAGQPGKCAVMINGVCW